MKCRVKTRQCGRPPVPEVREKLGAGPAAGLEKSHGGVVMDGQGHRHGRPARMQK